MIRIFLGLSILVVPLWRVHAEPVQRLDVFVAPEGDDRAPGTEAQPLATVAGAQGRVRQLLASKSIAEGEIVVHLQSGVFRLDRPIVFTPLDSGNENLTIRFSGDPRGGTTLSGGRAITGFKPLADGNWYVDLPEVADGSWSFRQLYVNGQLRTRARIPNKGFLRVAGFPEGTGRTVHYHTDCQSFEFAPNDIRADWHDLDHVEVIVYHFWTDSHLPIQKVDTTGNIVTFAHKAGKVFTDDFTTDGARYVVTNVLEGLDAPGEWYLDRESGRLLYRPMPGEDMGKVEVIAPFVPSLARFTGDALNRRFVQNIRLEHLVLEYTNFQLPPGNSNDGQGSSSVPAAITFTGARDCTLTDCTVRRLGTFAVEIGRGCRGVTIANNRLIDLGGGGIRVNGGTHGDPPLERTAENTIRNNEIGPYGLEYPSAVGVLLMHTAGNTVWANEIHHGGYTGISAGWVWGYGRSISRDNRIEFNHIHHIGQGLLSDMGGIYTLGVSPGTVLRNNHIHDVEANQYGGWGIYNDEGSSHILIENNVVHDTKFAPYNIHYAKEITVRNNIFAFGRLEQLSRGIAEPHVSCYFENNIVYWTEGELLAKNWQDPPHEFYFQPKKGNNSGGVRKVTSTFTADYNLYFNPNTPLKDVRFAGVGWEQWQARGKDRHSTWADPGFADVEQRDFTLKPDSPASRMGFRPIYMIPAGPSVSRVPAISLAPVETRGEND